MTLHSRIAVLFGLAAPWLLTPAYAADYEPPIFVEPVEEYTPVEIGSGWYLRGDVGYAVSNDLGTTTFRTFDPVSATYGQGAFDTQELDSEFIFGGGFGYRYNEWLRGDFTADGFRADFDGSTSSAAPCDGGPAGTSCRTEDNAEVSAISLMANAYVDLGTYVGVTPYVGAGLGYSYVSWSDLDSQAFCVDGLASCPDGFVGTESRPGRKDWRFTYALMAGIGYDITRNMKLDVGYKYRHIDGGDMFGWDAASAAGGATGVQGRDGDLSQHEISVGLRYELW